MYQKSHLSLLFSLLSLSMLAQNSNKYGLTTSHSPSKQALMHTLGMIRHGARGLSPCNNNTQRKGKEKRDGNEEEKDGGEKVRKINPLIATPNMSVMLWILTFISI